MSRYIVAVILLVALVAPAMSIHHICVAWRSVKDSCQANETMALCGRNCEPTCQEIPSSVVPIVERCPENFKCSRSTSGCTCEEGLVRNVEGKCVAPADCRQ